MTSNIAQAPDSRTNSEPRMIQMLTPEGERVSSGEYDAFAAELTDEDLRGFYKDMVLVRRVDAEGNALQRQGQLALWPPSVGQEAAQVGSVRAARAQDAADQLPDRPRLVVGDHEGAPVGRARVAGAGQRVEGGGHTWFDSPSATRQTAQFLRRFL